MVELRDEFLSEEDLDIRNMTDDELCAYCNVWLRQAQATNDLDEHTYSHGVFIAEPESIRGRAFKVTGTLLSLLSSGGAIDAGQ